MEIEWKQALTPETLELLSGIGTKPLKIIAATVYERERDRQRQGGDETENEEGMERKTEGKERETQRHNENPAVGCYREHSEAHADRQRGTHLQETAAKLFVHGENKQETNQLQKSMSTGITANHCRKQKTD